MTHNTDFAKGLTGLFGNIQSIGQVFHITSDEVLTWNQIYKAIADAAKAELKPIYIPSDFIIKTTPELEGPLLGDKTWCAIFDNTKIKRFVPDFVATVPFAQGIKRTIEWFETNPKRCTVEKTYNRLMDDLITAYEQSHAH